MKRIYFAIQDCMTVNDEARLIPIGNFLAQTITTCCPVRRMSNEKTKTEDWKVVEEKLFGWAEKIFEREFLCIISMGSLILRNFKIQGASSLKPPILYIDILFVITTYFFFHCFLLRREKIYLSVSGKKLKSREYADVSKVYY